MTEAASQGTTRAEMERLGFAGYFRFVAEHPALYRIIRQAEFVSPAILQLHYERLTSGYVTGLRQAMEAGEIEDGDAELLAWALMGIGELVGMRWILWAGATSCRRSSWRSSAGSSPAPSAPGTGAHDAGRAHGDSPLPPRALDDGSGGRRGERDPRGRRRLEVRAPWEAHRGRRRARLGPGGRRGRAAPRRARDRSRLGRRARLLRLDVEGLPGLAGRAVDRASPRLRQRIRDRVRQRLDGDAGGAPLRAARS